MIDMDLGECRNMTKLCLLDNAKECMDCGECEICDLDQNKICDNCCRCLGDADYNAIEVTEIIVPEHIKMKRKKPKKITSDRK
jgi:hypothetical protein